MKSMSISSFAACLFMGGGVEGGWAGIRCIWQGTYNFIQIRDIDGNSPVEFYSLCLLNKDDVP